ncbi:hypothetical protein GPECTOR_70g498 [Gonium pectorale]|uniref:Uncharacterized protein n=1 Tax=Gonium pectorale TaxID=33097 RepID=A0A150G339_GONPE|nr:hypothetical protein GPECTOR_70g498 [Gonium pectorale]|eukprot:KXZ44267.1 hypothetical protein GPECTOR_70g498 [Gonium pectorale]
MADQANACGGQPPESYQDCTPDGPGPHCLLRTRGFDFRGYCEAQPLRHLPEEAEARGIEWNELRAALSYDNMVGLAYIYDPARDPRQHLETAAALRREVAAAAMAVQPGDDGGSGGSSGCCGRGSTAGGASGGTTAGLPAEQAADEAPLVPMYVFVLHQEHGVNGHLLVTEAEAEAEAVANGGGSGSQPVRGRALTFEEYLALMELDPQDPARRGLSGRDPY